MTRSEFIEVIEGAMEDLANNRIQHTCVAIFLSDVVHADVSSSIAKHYWEEFFGAEHGDTWLSVLVRNNPEASVDMTKLLLHRKETQLNALSLYLVYGLESRIYKRF